MIRVEKFDKGSWYIQKRCKSMKEAKRLAQKISETHNGEVKAEKTDRQDYNLETFYYENGKNTESYTY